MKSDVRHDVSRMLGCVVCLAVLGLTSAVSSAPPGAALGKLGLHCLHLALGMAAFLAGFSVPAARLRNLAPGLLSLLFVLFVLMLAVPGLAHQSHGAGRWIGTPPLVLQPSAFLLCLWPVALASWAARDPLRLRQPAALWLLMLGMGGMLVPVLLQPDVGSVAILAVVTGITLFFAGAPLPFLRQLVLLVAAVFTSAYFLFDHVQRRIHDFFGGQIGYQEQAAQQAFALGGLTGTGPGLGLMKNGWVPEGDTDYVLAVIAEEWGLIGSAAVWLLFVLFTLYGVRAARRAEGRYGAILMASATVVVSIQAALNMAVVTGAVPPKGLPLPFVSRGGSSILALAALLGAALRAVQEPKRAPLPRPLNNPDSIPEITPWNESNALA